MATLLTPGITYTEVPIQWDTWEDAMVAVCAEEDKKWTAEEDAIFEDTNDIGNIPATEWTVGPIQDLAMKVDHEVIKYVQELMDKMYEESYRAWYAPAGVTKGPFSFLLEEKLAYSEKEVDEMITYQPVKPVEYITITWPENMWAFESDDLNIVEPVKPVDFITLSTVCPALVEDPKMRVVNSLFAMKEAKEQDADLAYFQNELMTSIGTDRVKAEKQLAVLEDAVVIYREMRLQG